MDNTEKIKRLESLKQRFLINSRFGKVCLERFTNEVNITTATHSEILEWFNNYLSNSAYVYNIVMYNIASNAMKKETENEVNNEYIKDIDDFIELVTEFNTLLKEKK